MTETICKHEFCRRFSAIGRQDQFSWAGREALFDYLEEYEAGTGTELEFDPIGLCCDYAEYEDTVQAAKEYGWEPEDQDERAALEWLQEQTAVIEFDGGVIIQSF